MPNRVYIETTVVSYLVSRPSRDVVVAARQQLTNEWWQERRRHFELCASQLAVREAAAGDPQMAALRLELFRSVRLLPLTEAAESLAAQLVKRGGIPRRAVEDALHIAIAAVHGIDYLLTWNCKHIANAAIQKRVRAVCAESRREAPVICTPEELMGE